MHIQSITAFHLAIVKAEVEPLKQSLFSGLSDLDVF